MSTITGSEKMRSRSPQRHRRGIRNNSPRKRSSSSSSAAENRNVDVKKRDKSERQEERHNRSHRRASEKQETRNKHQSRLDKDSPELESEKMAVARKGDSRKYSESVKRKTGGSRSRSVDKKRAKVGERKSKVRRSRSKSLEKKQLKVEGQNDRTKRPVMRSLDKSRPKHGGRRRRTRSRSLDNDHKMPLQGVMGRTHKKDRVEKVAMSIKEENKMSGYGALEESNTTRRPPPNQNRFDQTNLMLNERFSRFHEDKQLVFDESISIEIERNIDGDEPFVIPNFHPHEVLLPRRSDEGRKSLTSRKEFNSAKNEEHYEGHSERRVVTVMKSFNHDSAHETAWYRISQNEFGRGESGLPQPTLFWKDSGRDTGIQVPIVTSQKTKESDMEVTSATDCPRQRPARGQTRQDNFERPNQRSIPHSRDSRRFPAYWENQDSDEIRNRGQNFRGFRGRGNRGFELSGRRRQYDGSHSSFPPSATRGQNPSAREEDKNHPAELPDFSRRPDKYTYDAWKDKPEMIPKGRSYFEHDNRGEDDDWEFGRNRGRGGLMRGGRGRGFRGRGTQNFQSSGFAKRSGPVESLPWKHDKFETLLEDEKPSSTTEK